MPNQPSPEDEERIEEHARAEHQAVLAKFGPDIVVGPTRRLEAKEGESLSMAEVQAFFRAAIGEGPAVLPPQASVELHVRIPGALSPLDRLFRFEEPLEAALGELGAVVESGSCPGGTNLEAWSDLFIAIDPTRVEDALAIVRSVLRRREAPTGTTVACGEGEPILLAESPVSPPGFVVANPAATIIFRSAEAISPRAIAAAEALARTLLPDVEIAPASPSPHRSSLSLRSISADAPGRPDFATLRNFGPPLTEEEHDTFARGKGITVLAADFSSDPRGVRLREIFRLIEQLATEWRAIAYDSIKGQMGSGAAWQKRRLAGWEDDVPNTDHHVTLVDVQGEDRLVTQGLVAFGLPEIEIDQLSLARERTMGPVLALVAQRLVEGARPASHRLVLDIAALRSSASRAAFSKIAPDAPQTAAVHLVSTGFSPDDNEPEWTVRFASDASQSEADARQAVATALFGA